LRRIVENWLLLIIRFALGLVGSESAARESFIRFGYRLQLILLLFILLFELTARSLRLRRLVLPLRELSLDLLLILLRGLLLELSLPSPVFSDFQLYSISDLYGNSEVVGKPFVQLLLEEARAQDDEQRDDGDEYAGNIIGLPGLLALIHLFALVDAPEYFHVLELLPLGLVILIIRRHLVDQSEVHGIAHANHDLDQRADRSVDGAPAIWGGVRGQQNQDDEHHQNTGHTNGIQGIDDKRQENDGDWQEELESEADVNLGVVPAGPLLLVAAYLLIHLNFLLGDHFFPLV